MLKIKRDDEVIVIAGKDKGKRGKVQRVLPNGRLIVAGVNVVKKHVRANPNRGIQGGIVEQEAGIDAQCGHLEPQGRESGPCWLPFRGWR